MVALVQRWAYVHKTETGPLHPNLRNPKKAGKTWEGGNLLTTRHVLPRRRQDEDVCERACPGGGSQEHKVWRYAVGRLPRYNTHMLWEI